MFDILVDQDTRQCIQSLQAILIRKDEHQKQPAPVAYASDNTAFVFVKPAANTPKTVLLVRSHLQSAGLTVDMEGSLDGHEIAEHKFIDTHYGAIATKAV